MISAHSHKQLGIYRKFVGLFRNAKKILLEFLLFEIRTF